MPRPTKSKMIMEMARLGEVPPREWSTLEVSARLDELRAEAGLPPFCARKEKTALRKMVISLNEASKKKATLQEFAVHTLGIPVSSHETMAQLQKSCLNKIYQTTEARGEDPVGFGKFSSLSYTEVMTNHPDYVSWMLQTMKEDETNCDVRFLRLGHWCQGQLQPKSKPMQPVAREPISMATLQEKGYFNKKTKAMTARSQMSSASGAPSSAQMLEAQQMIQTLTGVVQELKEEVSHLKQERPRKEVKKEDDQASMNSFQMLPS